MAAEALGLRAGMPLAQAQALVPNLYVRDATPSDDEEGLRAIAAWALGYSPVVTTDPPDGLWIEIAGVAHLFGSEEGLLADLSQRLKRQGLTNAAAVADAPGAAWAMARYGNSGIVPVGRSVDAVATLPVQALRLPATTLAAMSKLGIDRVGQLAAMPRGPMVRRFGNLAALRLDQAMGHAFEPIAPLIPQECPRVDLKFLEPVGTIEALQEAVVQLSQDLCEQLKQRGAGIRRLDLLLSRVDSKSASLRIGTAKATRNHRHLAKLFAERLQTVDPGFGIEEMALIASKVEPLGEAQISTGGILDDDSDGDVSQLVDRLAAKVGSDNVYRLAPVPTLIPERMARRVRALDPPSGATWPDHLPRPTRLINPPEPIVATALLPDHPPALFVWRRVRHKVARADGPERITSEWWSHEKSLPPRDYYCVENEAGARFWIFRDAPADQGGRWWLHGFFA
jgi:protein ImuB